MSTQFKAPSFLSEATVYEVNIRQYTQQGTLKAFEKHLPRLRQMGVDVLWFMPLTPISQKGKKGSLGSYYACSNYMAINPEFGTEQDFKTLVEKAHELGFKVIIDWVANHTGLDHVWTSEPDWYVRDDEGNFLETHGWDDVIDLNYHNTEMQAAMIQAMKYWIGMFDIDGFRCDMAHLVPLHFWEKARTACEQLKQLLWLGECDEDSYSRIFDVTYAWRWMHDSEKLRDPASADLATAYMRGTLQHYQRLPRGAGKLLFTSNHDENSWNGTEYEKYGPLALTMSVFSFLYPATPLIYSGQELPLKKRLLFFDKDQINWPTSDSAGLQMEDFYKQMIALHRHPAISLNGEIHWITLEGVPNILAYYLKAATAKSWILVLLNFSRNEQRSCSLEGQLPEQLLATPLLSFSSDALQPIKALIDPTIPIEISPAGFKVWYTES